MKPRIYFKLGTWRAKDGIYMGMGQTPKEAFQSLRKVCPATLNLKYNERRHG